MNSFMAVMIHEHPAHNKNAVTKIWEMLTPCFMRWDETEEGKLSAEKVQEGVNVEGQLWSVWILDLSPCLSYWWLRAREKSTDVITLWRQVLDQAGVIFVAGAASHPWQALLLMRHMQERGLSGLTDYDSPLGRKLYSEMSWRNWWGAARQIIPHFAACGRKNLGSFARHFGQMRRAMKRLRINRPLAMQSVQGVSMQRRFGSVMGDLWRWTWALPTEGQRGVGGFPWRTMVLKPAPQVKRNFDYTVAEWDNLSPFLQEDFNRLCAMDSVYDAREHVLKMMWRLRTVMGETRELEISFRNPHNLHGDAPAHPTALMQARFAFETLGRDADGGPFGPDSVPVGLVSWEVIVTEKIRLLPHMRSLFDDQSGDSQRIAALENLLPIPLERYGLRYDWVPESSFSSLSHWADGPSSFEIEKGDPGFFEWSGCTRPLYLLQTPEALAWAPGARRVFLERTMEKWWQMERDSSSIEAETEEDSVFTSRDYYQMSDGDGARLWVFQNHMKQWFTHGLYA